MKNILIDNSDWVIKKNNHITHDFKNGCDKGEVLTELNQYILFYAHFKGICALLSSEKMILVTFMSISCKKNDRVIKKLLFLPKNTTKKIYLG